MSDLPPDSDSDWSEEELLLLRSADDDQPPSRALAATLAAVGIGAASGAAATASASVASASAAPVAAASTTAAKWGGAIAISKWVSVVAVGAAIAVSGIAIERHVSQPPRVPTRSTPQRPASPKPRVATSANEPSVTPAPSPSAAVEEPRGAIPPPRPARIQTPKRNALSGTAPALRGGAAVAPAQPDLSREIAAIDEARSALRQGHASEALAVLDRYEVERAKSGRLQLEAAALRIEVLFRLGDQERARSLAGAFLAKHPKSPYAARIRALLAGEATAR